MSWNNKLNQFQISISETESSIKFTFLFNNNFVQRSLKVCLPSPRYREKPSQTQLSYDNINQRNKIF